MSQSDIQHALDTAEKTAHFYLQEHHLPSVAITVVHRDQTIYNQAFGWQNVDRQIKATPTTVYRIASVSKTFAAVALMQLWEQGKFDLHAPVNDYLRAYKIETPSGAPAATFHHLLTHTAGIGEFANLLKYLSPRAHFNVVWPQQKVPPLASLYLNKLHAECPPGHKWCYANNGYATVGQLVADISGQTFPDYVREHILAPLEMDQSDFWRSERVQDNLAIGYNYKNGTFKPVIDLEQITTAAGAMYATPADMGNYLQMLVGNGRFRDRTILKEETVKMMFRPQFQLDPRLKGMGYGFKLDQWGDHEIVSHDGLWLGFVSYMHIAPADELAVFVTTNCTRSQTASLAYTILRRALGETAKNPPLPEPATVPPLPELWSELSGYYTPAPGFNTNFRFWQGYGGEVELYTDDEGLKIRAPRAWQNGRLLERASVEDPLHYRLGYQNLIIQQPPGEEPRLLYGKLDLTRRPHHFPVKKRVKVAIGVGIGVFLAVMAVVLRLWVG